MTSTGLENKTTEYWQALDRAHHVHPFTNHGELAAKGVRVVTRAEGAYLWDSDGNQLLDGLAGLWSVNVGYGRKELADAAYRQLLDLPYYNTFFQSTNPPAVELAAKLAEITPGTLKHVFFANSGSEANDSVVKIVRYYWNLCDRPDKKIIIGRRHGYHGVTLAAASLSGTGLQQCIRKAPALQGNSSMVEAPTGSTTRARHGPASSVCTRQGAARTGFSRSAPTGRGLHRRTDPGVRAAVIVAARELLAGGPAHLHEHDVLLIAGRR